MKKKQFMSKLAALTMAAAMGVTALPATVMAAGVKDVTAKNDTATNAATTGLVQTTLPTTVTGGEKAKAALYQAYYDYDAAVEAAAKVAGLGAKSTPQNVQDALTATVNGQSIKPEGDVTIIPATGNTSATAGSTTVQIKLPYSYGGTNVDTVPAKDATATISSGAAALSGTYTGKKDETYTYNGSKWIDSQGNEISDFSTVGLTVTGAPDNGQKITATAAVAEVPAHVTGATSGSQLLTLNVKWGTDVQDALSEAYDLVEKDIRTESTTESTAYYKLQHVSGMINETTGDFSEDAVKAVFGTTGQSEKLNTNTGYTATATIEGASNYVAPTATTDGSYDVKIKTTVSQKVAPNDTADRTDTFKVVIKKLGNAVVQAVTPDTTDSSSIALSAFKVSNIKKANTAYDINVSVTGTGIGTAESGKPLKKTEVAKANLTFTSSDTSIAEVVESTTSNTGYALKFKKPGKVKISYTCPNFKDANSTSATAIASKTANLQSAGSDVEVELKNDATALQSVVDGIDKTVNQADAADDTAAVAAAKTRVTEAVKAYYGRDDITVDVKNVSNFIAATSGTAEDTDGTDGSFYAEVTVTDNSNTSATVDKVTYKFTIKATPYTAKFTDVADTDYFAKAVAWGVDKDIVAGTTDTTFSPKADVTRAQFVTFLYRQAGSPDVEINKTFTDISGLSDEFQKAISWAAATGVTDGVTDTTFAPNATVNREQAVTFLFRYTKGEATTKTASFKDVDSSAYYADAVNWGAENGVVEGYNDDTFGVSRSTNRGEAITFIYRALAD